MRKITTLFLALTALIPTLSAKKVNMAEQPFFPIVGFDMLWLIDEDMVKDQVDMGLTMITIYGDQKELDWCEKYGMKTIIYRHNGIDKYIYNSGEADMKQNLINMVNTYKDHPTFYAFQVTDEPSKRVYDNYAKVYKTLKNIAPEVPIYTNFFPSWSQPNQHGFTDYEEYVETFCKLFAGDKKSQPFIYDNYRNKDLRLKPTERLASFLENLDTVERITSKYGLDFWVTVLSSQHDHYPEPTAADLDFQVFTSLAYGAKGIGYFITNSHQNMNFQGGPFNYLGDKTQTYYNLRELNFRVRQLAPVLEKLKFQGAYYSLIMKDQAAFKKYPMHKKLPGKLIKDIKGDRGNCSFLVTELKDDKGDDWVFVVNLSLENIAHFTPTLVEGKTLQHFNSYTGQLFPKTYVDPWLRPGQGKLYKVVDK